MKSNTELFIAFTLSTIRSLSRVDPRGVGLFVSTSPPLYCGPVDYPFSAHVVLRVGSV